jgi:bifunctional DNA-binding transcriptional regulator/antitoxin component of YhaV-PrlF toxin-antitoxin module
MSKDRYNVTRAVTGSCSLTLLFPIRIAEELGIRNGETLKFYVNGDRLIVEKYHNAAIARHTISTTISSDQMPQVR